MFSDPVEAWREGSEKGVREGRRVRWLAKGKKKVGESEDRRRRVLGGSVIKMKGMWVRV